MISMWRRCNLCQADILLMTCLLSLTGHYWVKGNDGWEGWIQTIFQSHRRKSKCRLHGVQLWIIFRLLYEMLAPLSLIEFIFVTASLYQSNSHHCTQWVNCHLSQWNFRFLLACNRYSDSCKGFNTCCCNDDTVSGLVRFSDSLAFGSALPSKWKWSNGVRRSEMSILSHLYS